MARHWLHYIDQNGLELLGGDANLGLPGLRFTATPQGVSAFRAHVARLGTHDTHDVLVDLPDEAFQLDTVPWVRGRDRVALLERRLSQRFPDTPYKLSLSLGRDTTGRRDERLLMAALTRPEAVAPWLEAMSAEALPVRSLRSPALLLPRLLDRMPEQPPLGLLITLSPAGIRQIFHADGAPRFARLSPAPDGPYAAWAPFCLHEANKSYQYLCAQRLLDRGARLSVAVFLDRADVPGFQDLFATVPTLEFAAIELAERLPIRDASAPCPSSDSRPLLAHLALEGGNLPQFAPAATLQRHRHLRRERQALIGGALGLVICSVLATKLQFDRAAFEAATEAHFAAARVARAQTEALRRTLPQLPDTPERIEALFETYTRRILAVPTPAPALHALSHAMDDFPDIALIRLEWKRGDQDMILPSAAAQVSSITALETIELAARLPDRSGESARARLQAFAATLREAGGGTVRFSGSAFEPEANIALRSDGEPDAERPGTFGLHWKRPARGAE